MSKRPKLPRLAWPAREERQYEETCGALVVTAWGKGTDRITAVYEREFRRRKDDQRRDERTIPGPLSIAIEGVSIVFGRLLDKQAPLVPVAAGAATAEANAAAVVGQLGAVIAVDPIAAEPWLGPVMEAWRASNTALIRGLGPDHSKAVDDLVRRAWTEGRTTEWLQRNLQARLGITSRRAETIARDQIGKLNGQLSMIRQSAYGITHYRWMTSMDDRVRELHAERHEQRFAWAEPPSDGHPGMPIQCRCVPEPDLDDALAELEREGEGELVIGEPDVEVLNRAIDELGQWQPDAGLLTQLKEQAAQGVRAMQSPPAATTRSRQGRTPARTARTPERSGRPARR